MYFGVYGPMILRPRRCSEWWSLCGRFRFFCFSFFEDLLQLKKKKKSYDTTDRAKSKYLVEYFWAFGLTGNDDCNRTTRHENTIDDRSIMLALSHPQHRLSNSNNINR